MPGIIARHSCYPLGPSSGGAHSPRWHRAAVPFRSGVLPGRPSHYPRARCQAPSIRRRLAALNPSLSSRFIVRARVRHRRRYQPLRGSFGRAADAAQWPRPPRTRGTSVCVCSRRNAAGGPSCAGAPWGSAVRSLQNFRQPPRSVRPADGREPGQRPPSPSDAVPDPCFSSAGLPLRTFLKLAIFLWKIDP